MPDDAYECALDIVRRVLRVDTLDVRQDFFALGATSLAMMQIVGLAEQECGARVSLMDAFDAVDIDAFARLAAERVPACADGPRPDSASPHGPGTAPPDPPAGP